MARSSKYGFIDFATPQACCLALPVSEISDLAFYVYADFKYTIGIRNSSGQVTRDGTQTVYDWFGSCVNGKDVDINLANILKCGECFNLVLLDADGLLVRAASNSLQYICDTEYTSVVRYLLNGPGFEQDCPTCINSVRLPLYLTEPQYPQTQEVYRLKSGYRRHLFAEIEKTYNLKTDFLPDELHRKLVVALSHDEVYINDLLLTKSESYTIDWGNVETIDGVRYAMASAGMVENVTARNDNCGECSVEGDTCDYEWLETDAVCQLAEEIETVEFVDYVCQLSWKEVTLLSSSNRAWWVVGYGNGRFVVITHGQENNTVAYSDNGGLSWSQSYTPYINTRWYGAAYGNGMFVAIVYGGNYTAYSSDGINWTISWDSITAKNWRWVAFGTGKFVTVADSTNIAAYSIDGISWTQTTMPSTAYWMWVAFGAGKFVAVADNSNKAAYSADGITWSAATLPTSSRWHCVAYGNGMFVAVAMETDKAAYSADGIAWTASTMPSSANWACVAYGNGMFVAITYGSGKAAYSYDGINWTETTLPSAGNFRSMAYGEGHFITAMHLGNKAEILMPAGKAFAESAIFKRYYGGELDEELQRSLMTDVYPELTEIAFSLLTEAQVKARADAVVALFEPDTEPAYLTEPVIDRIECIPALASFTWDDYVCQQSDGENTGNAIAKTLIYSVVIETVVTEGTYSILDAFGTYPAITESAYIVMTDEAISQRANALIEYALAELVVDDYAETNGVIEHNETLCPIPEPVYEFTFAGGQTSVEHEIMYNDTFDDTVVSTKDGMPAEFTVLSKPDWATVEINGSTATFSGNNSGAYREGAIVYVQTDTGETITSTVKQYGNFAQISFSLGLDKFTAASAHYPGFPPEDYGLSYSFEIKVDGVTYSTGSRSLALGSTETHIQSLEFVTGHNYAKTVEILIDSPTVDYPDGTATAEFGDSTTYAVMQGYITQLTVNSHSVYIKIEDKGGLSQVGGFLIGPVVILMPVDSSFAFEWTDRVCQKTGETSIEPTNKTDGGTFYFAVLGQDNKLYFGSNNNSRGIWRLDDDGQIRQTSKTDGMFRYAALGQDNKLYFVGSSAGIWRLDDDGQIRRTNKTTDSFRFAALGQDNKLYFGSSGSGVGVGIWRLDDDGEIRQTNITTGAFNFAALGQDGKLYFTGSSGSGVGIWRLDDDGEIRQTNITTGYFMFAALGQDNKLYFTGDNNSRGIWRLDDDGEIRRTNKTTDYFMFAALGQDNKLYFVGSGVGTGIWRLDDDGEIRQTNITTGTFNFAALGQDGKLYFCAYGTGIWRLDDDGEIRQTNKTTGYFYFAALGQDGKLYFAGDGIYYLYVPDNTGNALAKTLILQVLEDGTVIESVPYSILDAFGTYPAIVEADYTDMTDSDVETRAQALIEHVAAEEDIDEYTVSNEVIEYDTDMCPIPET